MEYRKLSTTDIDVSAICLGTMTWGRQNTEEEAHTQLDKAMEMGVNFLDTAEMYPIPPDADYQGRTETYIGNWLAKRGKRDDLVIASKVAGGSRVDSIRTRDATSGLTYDSVMEAIDGSLERLQTDYIDLYQVHIPDRALNNFGVRYYPYGAGDSTPIEETLRALNDVVKAGKVRYIGVSNETPWGVAEYLRLSRENDWPRIITIQNQYSLLNRTYEIGLSEFAEKESVRLLPYSPLSAGTLTGKYLDGAEPKGARLTDFYRTASRYNNEYVQPAIRRYVEIAKKYDMDPAQMALAFVNQQPFVDANIIGATTLEQLETDIKSIDTKIPAEAMQEIEEVQREMPDPQV